MQEPAEPNPRHLRAVADPAGPPVVEAAPEVRPRPVGASAAAYRREAELLRRVRRQSPIEPAPPPVPGGRPESPADVSGDGQPRPGGERLQTSDPAGSLGSRFEALAPSVPAPTVLDGGIPDRIDAALERLRDADRAEVEESLLLPSHTLRRLAAAGSFEAGEWLVALLASLHRLDPDLRMDAIVDRSVLAVTTTPDATVIESRRRPRRRSRRDLRVRGRADRLALAAAGGQARRVKGAAGLGVLARLLDVPHPVEEMIEDGVEVGPAALWRLVAASIAAVPVGAAATFVHSAGAGTEVTVTARPGRPLVVARGRSSGADGFFDTGSRGAIRWAAGHPIDSGETAPDAARLLFATAFAPIRRQA